MNYEVRVTKSNREDSKTKAFVSVTVNNSLALRGIRIVDGKNGLFVSFPGQAYEKNGEKQFREYFFPVSAEARAELVGAIMDAYNAA